MWQTVLVLFLLVHAGEGKLGYLAKSAEKKANERRKGVTECQREEHPTAFGILYGGDNPLKLRSMDLLRVDGPAAFPLANPVLTPALLKRHKDAHATLDAMAQPMLLSTPDYIYMFFAARACETARWGIAAAQSSDGGMTWKSLGLVLGEEHADLLDPAVFQHNNEWYMVPEFSGGREVRLYKATKFPVVWQLQRKLLDVPLRGVSVVRHNKKWLLVGHRDGHGADGQDHVLAIYHAKSPLGPWTRHLNTSFAAEAATTMGRVFKWKNQLCRLGRACRRGVCGPLEVLQMFVSEESFEQDSLSLDLGRPLWRQAARWDSAGWSHMSLERRISDGAWLAVVESSQLPLAKSELPMQLRTAVAAFKAMALLSIGLLLLSGAARMPSVRSQLLRQSWGQSVLAWALCGPSRKRMRLDVRPPPAKAEPPPAVLKLIVHDPPGSPAAAATSAAAPTLGMPRSRSNSSMHRRVGSGGILPGSRQHSPHGAGASGAASWFWQQPCRRLRQSWRPALAVLVLLLSVGGTMTVRFVEKVAQPFWEQPSAVPVQGHYSRFTLMVMSYEARLQSLQWYVRHYSQCPSVGEILVVWNKGTPPDPRTAFQSDVPVRVRVEAVNSMNNRFRPDPGIKFRSVLSLDDDILIPCTTIEQAFALWRRSPHQLVGFYPRLLTSDRKVGPPVLHWEDYVFKKGEYNAILAGAAFMDSSTAFPAYFADEVAPARKLVDEVFNCDDLLLNFVVANWTASHSQRGKAPVQLVRPERRIDISRLSGVGISHNPARFKAAADRCLAEFSKLFGGSPLRTQKVDPGYGPPPTCTWPFDCMYL